MIFLYFRAKIERISVQLKHYYLQLIIYLLHHQISIPVTSPLKLMLVDQEALICQLNINTSLAKIAQRNQAQKTKERAEGVTANKKQSNKHHSATTTTTETENPRSR